MLRQPLPSLASDGAQALGEKIERPNGDGNVLLGSVFKVQHHLEQCQGHALNTIRRIHRAVPPAYWFLSTLKVRKGKRCRSVSQLSRILNVPLRKLAFCTLSQPIVSTPFDACYARLRLLNGLRGKRHGIGHIDGGPILRPHVAGEESMSAVFWFAVAWLCIGILVGTPLGTAIWIMGGDQ